MIPHQGFYLAFLSHPTQRGLFCGAVGMEKIEGIFVSHILLSQKPDLNKKQVIDLDQDVHVCGYFWWMVYGLLLHEPYLLYSFSWI
jgi:hypothetical protein